MHAAFAHKPMRHQWLQLRRKAGRQHYKSGFSRSLATWRQTAANFRETPALLEAMCNVREVRAAALRVELTKLQNEYGSALLRLSETCRTGRNGGRLANRLPISPSLFSAFSSKE